MKRFYQVATAGRTADIFIYGEIVTPDEKAWREWWGDDAPVSGLSLTRDIAGLDVDIIHVHINSYGGAVSEGMAIYNALKQHPAQIKTYNDGFCCSAAVLPWLAGDVRVASETSAFLFHQVMVGGYGNADEFRALAEELDTLTELTMTAYMAHANISEDEMRRVFKAGQFLAPEYVRQIGLATTVEKYEAAEQFSASARGAFFNLIFCAPKAALSPVGQVAKRTIGIDFDGCLCENKYPEIGSPNQKVIAEANVEKESGSRLILWTCRTGDHLEAALKACESWGLVFDAVNENTKEMIQLFGSDTRKVAADEYWDDKAVKKTFADTQPENKVSNFLNALTGRKD